MDEGTTTEGLLEELLQSVSEQVLQNWALERPLSEGVDSAAAFGIFAGGAMGAGRAGLHHLAARPAQREPQQLGRDDASGPLERAARKAQPEKAAPLQLSFGPTQFVTFPDGSTGTHAELDTWLQSLPENERSAAMVHVPDYTPQAVYAPMPALQALPSAQA